MRFPGNQGIPGSVPRVPAQSASFMRTTGTLLKGIATVYAAVVAAAPALTVTTNGAATLGQQIVYNDARLRFTGAVLNTPSGFSWVATGQLGGVTPPFVLEFILDDIAFEIFTGSAGIYRITVDGVRDTASNGTFAAAYTKFTFAARAIRHIRIEMQNVTFGKLVISATGDISLPPQAPPIKHAYVSDSFGSTNAPAFDSFMQEACRILRHECQACALSGMGYCSVAQPAITKLQEVLATKPDVITVALGYNDRPTNNALATVAALTAATATYFAALRAGFAGPILAIGPWAPNQNNAAVAEFTNARNVIRDAAKANRISFADPLTGNVFNADGEQVLVGAGPWIRGTGKVGTTAGDGPADIYTAADGVHPTYPAGHYAYGRFAAQAFMLANDLAG